jgi:transcriptional activator protein UGA3
MVSKIRSTHYHYLPPFQRLRPKETPLEVVHQECPHSVTQCLLGKAVAGHSEPQPVTGRAVPRQNTVLQQKLQHPWRSRLAATSILTLALPDSMGRKPTACQKCAAIKAKCSGQGPCARCQRLQLPCSLARGLTGSSSTIPDPLPPAAHMVAVRARHLKSSKGCANCRRRRKKCDERKPTCGDCARLNLHCLPRSDQSLFEPLPPSPAFTIGPNGGAEISDESDDEADVAPILNWSDIILSEIERENSPQSLAHSSALRVLPDKRASDEAPPPEGITLAPIALSIYAGINPAAQDSWTAGERHLLNHFIQSVARSMSTAEDRYNPFICLIAPKVFESKAIRNAVAALSATHLSRVYPDFVRNQLMHRDMALENLKAILEIPEEAAAALGATLILCLCEVCFTRRGRTYQLV